MKKKNKLGVRSFEKHNQLMTELEQIYKQWSTSTQKDNRQYDCTALHINEAMFTYDMDGNILDCNAKHTELFGYTQDEIKKLKLRHFHPQDKISELTTIVEKFRKHGIVHFEIPMLKKNGDIFPASITAVLMESSKGLFGQSMIRDLSDREYAQRKIKASERKYRMMLEIFFDAIIIHKNGKILKANQQTCKMLGYSQEQLLSMTIFDFYNPLEHDSVKKRIHRFRKNIHFESRWEKADGGIVDVEIYSSITDRKNHIITSMIRDITGRKQIEAKIRDSEQQFRSIFNNSLDGIILFGPDDKPLMVNPAFCHMHGYTVQEVFSLCGNDFVEADQKAETFLKVLSQKGYFTGVVVGIKKDGTRFPAESAAKIVINSRNEICRLVIIRDISHQKRIEKELEAARQVAEKASCAKSEFLANMSHEIRTPLNGVMGVISLLLNTELNLEQLDLLQTGKRSANSLLTIINDILDFSKIEADQMDLEIIDFNLRDTIAEIVEVPALRAEKKGLEFIYHIQPEIPSLLRGDPARLRQIIHNLTENAVKFTTRGKIVLRISLGTETDMQVDIRFEVNDTGIGIPREKLATIFEPFKQSDASTSRQYGGTGLGLTISKRLVNLMGGDIGVTSVENQGSKFSFNILLEKQNYSGIQIQAPPEHVKGKRFLLVDDNQTTLRILKSYIEAWGCHCDLADSGKTALSMLDCAAGENTLYDAAIINFYMPEMDGIELGRLIKNDPRLKNIKMVLLTPMWVNEISKKIKEIGFSAYLAKPARQSQLYTCLTRALSGIKQPVAIETSTMVDEYTVSNSQRKQQRILIVEDNPINQKLALKMVTQFGFHVDCCSNGKEALEALEKTSYNLVLMDIQMPVMDGLEATRMIRAPESKLKNHAVKIIAMTAYAMQGDKERCLEAGMDDYISKPIQPDELLNAIEQQILL